MRVVSLLVAICAVAVFLPASAGNAAEPGDRKSQTADELRTVNDSLEEAQDALAGVERQRTATLADVQRVDARRAFIEEELARLRGRLSMAESRLATAQRDLAGTNHALITAEEELLGSNEALQQRRWEIAARARSAYSLGGVGYAEAVLGAGDINEMGRSIGYLRAVVDSDLQRLEEAAGLQDAVSDARERFHSLRDHQARQRAEAAAKQGRVAELVARHQDLQEQADAAAEAHRQVLAELDGDRRTYRQLVATLAAEGSELEDRLRAIAEAERRAGERDVPAPARGDGRLYPPIAGMTSSNFGWRVHPIFGTRRFHAGMDTGAPTGTPIRAAAPGTVYSAGWLGGYGNAVILNHGDGLTTLYAHQSSIAASAGDTVTRGQVIGYVGSTGYSTGPHLHFEVRVDGVPQDPITWL